MRRILMLFAMLGLLTGTFISATEKEKKKANFSGTWIVQKSKVDQGAGTQQGGGRGMGRGGTGRGGGGGGRNPGRNPGGGNPGGGRPGGGRGGIPPGMAQPKDTGLIIEHSQGELKVTHKVDRPNGEREFVQVFKLNGEESVNPGLPAGELKTRTSWNNQKLVTLGVQEAADAEDNNRALGIVFKQEFSLSKDGKTLTVLTRRSSTRGQITTTDTFTRKGKLQ